MTELQFERIPPKAKYHLKLFEKGLPDVLYLDQLEKGLSISGVLASSPVWERAAELVDALGTPSNLISEHTQLRVMSNDPQKIMQ